MTDKLKTMRNFVVFSSTFFTVFMGSSILYASMIAQKRRDVKT